MVPPYPVVRRRLDRALAARDLEGVRAAARELPGGLGLGDALAVVVVMEELEDPRFERAAVRFIGRFVTECGGGGLGEVQAALEALDAFARARRARHLDVVAQAPRPVAGSGSRRPGEA